MLKNRAWIRLYKNNKLVGYEYFLTNNNDIDGIFHQIIKVLSNTVSWDIISVECNGVWRWGKYQIFFI